MPGRALIAHSGGPTPVINASLAGAVEQARKLSCFGSFWGARFGLEGILAEDFVDLFAEPAETLSAIAHLPSSALGTSRLAADANHLTRVIDIFRRHEIRYLFYTGGNGSMGTGHQLCTAAHDAGYELQVLGIPKTIDNDLLETDHTPGYGSAARFFAHAVRDIGEDNRALPGQVEIVEILGRNAGWIAAATSLARHHPDDAPHLIYLPELRLPLSKLLNDVEQCYRRLGRCVVAVCEGQLDEHGNPFGADVRPGSRSSLAMNLAHRLARLITENLGLRARSEKPGLLGRSASAYRSATDAAEARLCGEAAVRAAKQGASDCMVTLVRSAGPEYAVTTGSIPLERVAFAEKLFPIHWISPAGNNILPPFRAYALPLVGTVDSYTQLSQSALQEQLT